MSHRSSRPARGINAHLGIRGRALRCADARFSPPVQVSLGVKRTLPGLSEDRAAANASQFCKPAPSTGEAPSFAHISGGFGPHKVARFDVHFLPFSLNSAGTNERFSVAWAGD